MNVKTVSVTYERKFNLGNYESATVGATLWADLDGDDDPTLCRQELFEAAKESVRVNALPLMRQRTEQVNEILQGLPVELQTAVKAGLGVRSNGNANHRTD